MVNLRNPYEIGHYRECAMHEDSTGFWCVECHQPTNETAVECGQCGLTASENCAMSDYLCKCDSPISEIAKCVCDEIDVAKYEEQQEWLAEARRDREWDR